MQASTSLKYVFILTVGMMICLIPGIWLAPFGIDNFDEPYQILNAYDWQNAPYSPLSSFLASLWGNAFEWKWLSFRYLSLILNFLAIYCASLYALFHCKKKYMIILAGCSCVVFNFCIRNVQFFYGWDCWTVFMDTMVLIVLLSYQRSESLTKLLAIAILSGITTLMRIPNICIIPIVAVALFFGKSSRRINLSRWPKTIIFLIFSILTAWAITCMLFGSLDFYIDILRSNAITEHSSSMIFREFFGRLGTQTVGAIFLVAVCFAFKMLFKTRSPHFFIWIAAAVFFAIITVTLFTTSYSSNVSRFVLVSVSLFCIMMVFFRPHPEWIHGNGLMALSIFGIGCVAAVGSNLGFYKFTVFATFPLVMMLLADRMKNNLKITLSVIGLSLLVYSPYSFVYASPAWTDSFHQSTYRISGGVMDGMYTNENYGKKIELAIAEAAPFREKGFDFTVVRIANDYIWEYIFLEPNQYLRHSFNFWEMLEDKAYADHIIEKAESSSRPPLILYMDIDYDPVTLMQTRLEEKMTRVVDGPGYCMYAFPKDMERYFPEFQKNY